MKLIISNKENDLLRHLLQKEIMDAQLIEHTLSNELRQNCLNHINFMNILLEKLRNNIKSKYKD